MFDIKISMETRTKKNYLQKFVKEVFLKKISNVCNIY